MATALLIIHGLVAVALLGAITHQTLATWAPARARPGSFFGRFRAVPSASFANAIVVLYAVSALLGAIVYLYFRVDIRPELERAGHWQALGLFDIKEHFVSIGLGTAAGLLGLLAAAACRRTRSNARRPDLDPCLHRLVELSDRSRREQHHGLRVMTSSLWFRRFAFAYGTAFAVLYVIALKRISRCSPSIPRLASSFWARTMRGMSSIPRWGSLPRDVLVRLDGHGCARSAHVRSYCRIVA